MRRHEPVTVMKLSSVRLRQLEYLDAVARLGGFGDAADELGVSQPALSQGLQRLENAIGVPLFEAAGRSRTLTHLGREAAQFAATVLSTSDIFEQTVSGRAHGTAGVLRVGMIDAVALYLKADVIGDYRTEYPDVDLRVTIAGSATLLDHLASHRIDMAIVVAPAPPTFAGTPLLTEALYAYGSGDAGLDEVPRWLLYPTGSHTRRVIDAAFATAGVIPNVEAESGNPSVLAQLVRMGAGAAVLPAGIAESGPEPLTRAPGGFASRDLVIVMRPATVPDALLAGFVDAMTS